MQGYLDALHKAKIYKNLQKTMCASIGIMMMTIDHKKDHKKKQYRNAH